MYTLFKMFLVFALSILLVVISFQINTLPIKIIALFLNLSLLFIQFIFFVEWIHPYKMQQAQKKAWARRYRRIQP